MEKIFPNFCLLLSIVPCPCVLSSSFSTSCPSLPCMKISRIHMVCCIPRSCSFHLKEFLLSVPFLYRLWRNDVSINKKTTNIETTVSSSKMQMDLPMQMPETRSDATKLHHSTHHTNTRSTRRNKKTQHGNDEDDKE